MRLLRPLVAPFAVFVTCLAAKAEIVISSGHNGPGESSPAWQFAAVPYPSTNDFARTAQFRVVDGRADPNSGGLEKLNDGLLPTEEDEPGANFFFRAGTAGGRLLMDAGHAIEIKRVASYSWHAADRAPQVYTLYGSDGLTKGFVAEPARPVDPSSAGWVRLAEVDTRAKTGEIGGQYGVNITNTTGVLGKFRFLLFDIRSTEDRDPFGNTFFSEIDIVEQGSPDAPQAPAQAPQVRRTVVEVDGGYRVTIDTSDTQDLSEWVESKLVPMVKQWYGRISDMLPSDGYEAPKQVTIVFRKDMNGVAATGGTRVSCAARWFRANLQGEAVGAVFHELVHVVQQYGRTRPQAGAVRAPGWLTEGIADYLRWFKYEPDSHGAEITRNNIGRARYDGNYRITANFLNWVSEKYDTNLVRKLNAAIRQGKYNPDLWNEITGHTVQDLGADWKAAMEQKVADGAASK